MGQFGLGSCLHGQTCTGSVCDMCQGGLDCICLDFAKIFAAFSFFLGFGKMSTAVFFRARPYFGPLRPYFEILRPYFELLRPYFELLRPYFPGARPYFRTLRPYFIMRLFFTTVFTRKMTKKRRKITIFSRNRFDPFFPKGALREIMIWKRFLLICMAAEPQYRVSGTLGFHLGRRPPVASGPWRKQL